jgi:anti-sigma regulatory factor (Ser/Thr protein kinase)
MRELSVEAITENLDAVLRFINEQIEYSSVKVQNQINVVVDEIFANISSYAYNPAVGGVTVRIKADANDITIEFEDSGIPYNPLSNAPPDVTLDGEQREIGGLGIHLVRNMMDSVGYRRDGNKNIMTIKKII